MKRLVVCCDGTWNRPDSPWITNVEKIARTVQSDPRATGDVHQFVFYVGGVGTGGCKADNLLGGAFGEHARSARTTATCPASTSSVCSTPWARPAFQDSRH